MKDIIADQFKHLIGAIKYSLRGLAAAGKKEKALQQELIIFAIIIPLGCILGKTGWERAILIGTWFLVIIVELLNSAIESAVDRIGLEHHELSSRAKDLGSAAVFCAIILSIFIWMMVIFFP